MVGSTFAYFTATVSGEGNNTEIVNAKAATVSATYTDGAKISVDNIDPGWSGSKEISIENTSDAAIDYVIAFDDDEVAYSNGFGNLEYKLEKKTGDNNNDDGGANIVGITSDFVKMEATSLKTASDNKLVTGHLGAHEKHEFTLTIQLKNLEENQNDADAGKTFTGKLLASAQASKVTE